jgi:Fe-S-cluster containining protein
MELDKQAKRLGRKTLKVIQQNEPAQQLASRDASCKKGCDSCCYLLVMTTLPEATIIAEHILKDPVWLQEAKIEELIAKLYRQVKVLTEPPEDDQDMSQGIPCVFLDMEKKECLIYDQRPSACRYHYVTSDPSLCSPLSTIEPDEIDMRRFEQDALDAATRVSGQVGTPLGLSPLAVAVSWALKILTEGTRALDKDKHGQMGAFGLEFWEKSLQKSNQSQIVTGI